MNLSLKNKIVIIISLTSGLSLILGLTFFTWHNIRIMKEQMLDNAQSTVNLAGNYCISDLSYSDKESAKFALSLLEPNNDVIMAVLYNSEGQLFATFSRDSVNIYPKTLPPTSEIRYTDSYIEAFSPIYYKNIKFGTLYIKFSTQTLNTQINSYIYSVLIVIGILILLILFLASWAQKIITQPILSLAKATREISEKQDFSVRVKHKYGDEIGTLYDSFNHLLNQIHLRDKQAKEALTDLQESEERYRKVVELSPSAIILHQEGKIIYANTTAARLSGLKSAKDFIGKNIYDFVHPEFVRKVQERVKLMKTGLKDMPEMEEKFVLPDGRVAEVQVVAVPFQYARKLTILTIIHDISKIRQAERSVRQSEIQFRSIFERSNDAMYVLIGSHFQRVNPKFLELFGYEEKEILNPDFDILTLVADESKPFIKERKEKSARGEFVPTSYSFKGKSEKGELLDIEINLSQIEWNEQPAILGIVRNVTERRILEEQLRQSQKMEAIGTLAGGVAHDFNNLLTVISGHVELAQLKLKVDDPLKRHILEIEKAGKRAQNLTRQLLAFSRKQIIKLKTLNINNIITDMEKMLGRLIGEDINMKTVLEDKIAPIKADPGQIEQIIMNLIVNARDAIHANRKQKAKRQITIETSNVYLEDNGEFPSGKKSGALFIMLAVSDSGVGMSEQIRTKIFEPFFTTKGVGQGTGLGLATIYGIVKQNDGRIYVYSEVGRGTTFKIYWPCATEGEQKEEEPGKSILVATGKESILFVEDDESVREFAVTALQDLGYSIHQAENAIKALDMVKKDKIQFDLLVTDLVMPEMSGKKLADILNKERPGIKVLFTSGYTEGKIVSKGILKEGINFLQKPYSLRDISRRIRSLLDSDAV